MANSIYGTVLSMAMVTAYSADDALDPELIAVGVVVTVVVFWLAHAQAELLALRYKVGHALAGAEIREQLRHGWPMVEASYPLAVALVLGGVGLLGEETSIYLALGLGVAELAGWGVAIGRREQLSAFRLIGVTALNVALGLLVVVLKLVIH